MALFVTACSKVEEKESDEMQASASTKEQVEVVALEQPVLTLENVENGVLVKWNAIPGAEGYYVYSKVKGDKFKVIATITEPTTIEYTDLEAPMATDYCYTVRAYAGENMSDYKAYEIKTAIWETKIKVTYSKTKMKVTWEAVEGVDGYIVFRKEKGGEYTRLSKIKDPTTTSYTDKEVVPGKIYVYAVSTYLGGEKSNKATATKAAIAKPDAEVNVSNQGVEIKWNKIEEAEGYYVFRKEAGKKYETIQTIEDNSITSFLDTNFSVGTEYTYAVSAYIGKYKSAYSTGEETVADLGRVDIVLETTNDGVRITWNESAIAEGYYIYRKEESEADYSLVDTITDISITSYLDEDIEKGKTYYYSVRAFLGDSLSSYSGASIATKR